MKLAFLLRALAAIASAQPRRHIPDRCRRPTPTN